MFLRYWPSRGFLQLKSPINKGCSISPAVAHFHQTICGFMWVFYNNSVSSHILVKSAHLSHPRCIQAPMRLSCPNMATSSDTRTGSQDYMSAKKLSGYFNTANRYTGHSIYHSNTRKTDGTSHHSAPLFTVSIQCFSQWPFCKIKCVKMRQTAGHEHTGGYWTTFARHQPVSYTHLTLPTNREV